MSITQRSLRSLVFTTCAALAAFALTGCLLPGGDGDDAGGKGDLTAWGAYTFTGDVVSVTGKSSWYTCDPELGVPLLALEDMEYDDTVSIQGNTMMRWSWSEPVFDENDDSVALVEYGLRYVRQGNGSGIRGTWRFAEYSAYRVLEGTIPAEVATQMRYDSLLMTKFYTYMQTLSEYTADSVFFRRKVLHADLFLATWYGQLLRPDQPPTMADSAYRNISVSKVDQNTVRLHGKTTGEIVTYWYGNTGDYRYTSNNPARDTIEYIRAKHVCTGPTSENWYSEFLLENSRFPVDTTGEMTITVRPKSDKPGNAGTTAHDEFLRRASRIRGPR